MSFTKKRKGNLVANGVANWLGQKTKTSSNRQRKIGLVVFCVLSSCYLISGLSSHENIFPVPAESRTIVLPKGGQNNRVLISPLEIEHIRKANELLDSLRSHDSARFQDLIQHNPEILENIRQLESYYQSQNK